MNASPPDISFLIPCYNYGRYLGDCLESIFRQEGDHNFEIVAVDDCSTDETARVLRDFAEPRLRVVTHQVNQGHVATMNQELPGLRGRFVARIDPDDRYRPYFLDTVMPIFAAHPDVGVVYGDAAVIDGSGTVTEASTDRIHGGRDFRGNEYVALLERNFICAPTLIARREAWQVALPIPTRLAFNDWYLTLHMARRYTFYYTAAVLADYRVHAGNLHTQIARDRREEESVFWLLDALFASPEESPELERQKREARRRIYAAHYLDAADKYFFFGMTDDARRCYLRALQFQPVLARRAGVLRHVTATLVGQKRYERAKELLRGAGTSGDL